MTIQPAERRTGILRFHWLSRKLEGLPSPILKCPVLLPSHFYKCVKLAFHLVFVPVRGFPIPNDACECQRSLEIFRNGVDAAGPLLSANEILEDVAWHQKLTSSVLYKRI